MNRNLCKVWVLGIAVAVIALLASGQAIELPRTVPSFNQAYADGPGAWGDFPLGTGGCPDRIRTTGCLITAFASVLAYYDIGVAVTAAESATGRMRRGMDPGILNDWLRANGGYGRCAEDPIGRCCLVWAALPGGVRLTFHVNRSDVGVNPVASVVIDHALRQGRPVIAGVHWSAFCHGGTSQTEDCHWVVIVGKVGSAYRIVDPYNPNPTSRSGILTTLDAGVRGAYIIDRFVVVEGAAPVPPDTVDSAPDSGATGAGASLAVLLLLLAVVAGVVFLVAACGASSSPP